MKLLPKKFPILYEAFVNQSVLHIWHEITRPLYSVHVRLLPWLFCLPLIFDLMNFIVFLVQFTVGNSQVNRTSSFGLGSYKQHLISHLVYFLLLLFFVLNNHHYISSSI